jgi:hypothetical protein
MYNFNQGSVLCCKEDKKWCCGCITLKFKTTQFVIFFSIFIMNCNVEGVMQKNKRHEPNYLNVAEVHFFPILVHKLSKYMKIVKIVMVQMLGLVEDEKTFSKLFFMKNKMCN